MVTGLQLLGLQKVTLGYTGLHIYKPIAFSQLPSGIAINKT